VSQKSGRECQKNPLPTNGIIRSETSRGDKDAPGVWTHGLKELATWYKGREKGGNQSNFVGKEDGKKEERGGQN